MRIIRFLDPEGRVLLGEDHREGRAAVLIEPQAILGVDPVGATLALLRGKRVLVADDDENMRLIIATVLDSIGCDCRIAADGAEAMDAIENDKLDLVVSDIRMPHHDGYEIFSASRRLHPDIPVLLVTGFGYDPTHTLVRTTSEGHSTVLYKPFSPQQLREAVCQAVHETIRPSRGFLPTNHVGKVNRILPPLEPGRVVMTNVGPQTAGETDSGSGPDRLKVMIEPAGTVCGPDQAISVRSAGTGDTEVESRAELAIVIGAEAEQADYAVALDHVLGVSAANRLTIRRADGSAGAESGASDSVFCGLGPALLTPDELQPGERVTIATLVDGVRVKTAHIDDLPLALTKLVAQLSRQTVLEPGMTVLAAAALEVEASDREPIMLRDGQSVTVEVGGIGALTSRIEVDPDPSPADRTCDETDA
ncbi:MAG: fumarylacetoacetate hydrolase family protein [Phycisphaerales bacterium]|nr:MAG: fumarylacetoacetate hydrolase family protein [Phycisphaerales bacterium]